MQEGPPPYMIVAKLSDASVLVCIQGCPYHGDTHLSTWSALQSLNMCLADACGALHCDYYNSLSTSKSQKQSTCKPAVVERNRHSCEVRKLNTY